MAKKLLSLSLVVIMLFAFAVPAFASVESDLKADVAAYVYDTGTFAVTADDINAGTLTYTISASTYYVTVDCGDYIFTCTAKYNSILGYVISDGKAEVVESSNWFMSIIIKIVSFFMNIFSGLSDILTF